MKSIRVLHLVGSAQNEFFRDLSIRNAQCCLENTANVESIENYQIGFVTPDGQWRFPRSLSQEDLNVAKSMSLSDAIDFLLKEKINLMIPHMYCIFGMTHYRSLFDLLQIAYIGNKPDVMAIGAHKGKTKAIVAAAGVKVPLGQLLRKGDVVTIQPPVVVKPANADNSFGISLVKETSEYDVALNKAFEYADEVLVETFIKPGREVRCAVIVKDNELIPLPLEEYWIDPQQRPIRTFNHKFPELDADGQFLGWPEDDHQKHWISTNDDLITKKVQEIALKCHIALNCRHFSQFDFRIDPDGEVWFLEAGLYTSFGGGGGVCGTAERIGISLNQLFDILIKQAMNNI